MTSTPPVPDRVLCEISRRDGNSVRVMLRQYRGQQYLDVRLWWHPQDTDDLAPTSKGVSLRVHEIAQVASALDEAIRILTGAPLPADPTEGW